MILELMFAAEIHVSDKLERRISFPELLDSFNDGWFIFFRGMVDLWFETVVFTRRAVNHSRKIGKIGTMFFMRLFYFSFVLDFYALMAF